MGDLLAFSCFLESLGPVLQPVPYGVDAGRQPPTWYKDIRKTDGPGPGVILLGGPETLLLHEPRDVPIELTSGPSI